MGWFDNHCHVDDDRIPGGTAAALAAAREAGVTGFITVGTDAERSEAAIAVAAAARRRLGHRRPPPARRRQRRRLHPPAARRAQGRRRGRVRAGLPLRPLPPSGAAGGLRGADRARPRARAAPRHPHPLRLGRHVRRARGRAGCRSRTIFHCFTGGPEEARRCLDLGAYLSFSGIVTFPSAGDLREAAALCPADRLLVETDAPYLAPVPHRGQRNQPAFVPLVGAALAEVRGVSVDRIEDGDP